MGRYQRADYRWLLLADPPVCRAGRPEVVLNNCDRIRKGEPCWCRFESNDINEDLAAIGASGTADDWLTAGDLDPRDVEDFRDAMRAAVDRARRLSTEQSFDDEGAFALDRVEDLVRRLGRLVEHESGLSDRHSDDVET